MKWPITCPCHQHSNLLLTALLSSVQPVMMEAFRVLSLLLVLLNLTDSSFFYALLSVSSVQFLQHICVVIKRAFPLITLYSHIYFHNGKSRKLTCLTLQNWFSPDLDTWLSIFCVASFCHWMRPWHMIDVGDSLALKTCDSDNRN